MTTEHLAKVVQRYGTGDATQAIVALIERALHANREAQQQQRIAEGKDRKRNPYISEIAGCERKIVKSLLGHEPSNPDTTDSLVNYLLGSAAEEMFAGILDALDIEVWREVRVELPTGPDQDEQYQDVLTGRIDFLFANSGRVVELKTISSRSMGFMLRKGEKGQAHHRVQAGMYLHASQLGLLRYTRNDQEHVAAPMDTAYLVYIVKDATKGEPTVHAFEVAYNEIAAHRYSTRAKELTDLARKGEVPPIPQGYTWSQFPCGWCDYQTACHG